MKSFGVSSSFLRRCTVSASSERTYACRSCTWISYSVSRRRVLESDMEAGRNFENPSRLGLLFLSNSFIAHPFSHVCAARPGALASCSKYRRREKRNSRLAAYLPSVESLNLQDFFPSWAAPGPVRMFVRPLSALGSKFRTALNVPPPVGTAGRRPGFHVYTYLRISMRVLLVRLPVILLTLVLAWPASAPAQPPSAPGPPSIRREVRVGVPGVPGARSRRGARGDDPPHRAAGLRHTRRLSRRHDRRGAGARDPLVCLSRRPHVVVHAARRREVSRRDPAYRGRGRGELHPPVPSRRRGDGGGLARPLPGDTRRRQGREGGRHAHRADLARPALRAAGHRARPSWPGGRQDRHRE